MTTIVLNTAEVQSGLNRVKWAQSLIEQLPPGHDGRNSWLLNYGVGEACDAMRARRDLRWDEKKSLPDRLDELADRYERNLMMPQNTFPASELMREAATQLRSKT